MVTKIRFFLLLTAIFWINTVWAVDVSIEIDRDPVYKNDSFILTYKVTGDLSVMPDFSPLQNDFQVLSHSERSELYIANGTNYGVFYFNLELLPKHSGTIQLPSIQFDNNRSNARLLTVLDGSAISAKNSKPNKTVKASNQQASATHEPIVIDMSINKQNLYLQEQGLITIKLYYNVPIVSATLTDPVFKDGEALVLKLGEDKSYSESLKGKHYEVIERRYAIYPQKEGKLKINNIEFEGSLGNQLQSYFGKASSSSIKRVQSKPLTISVEKPLFEPWIPAKKIELTESWSDNVDDNKGNPITRTVTIKATGQPFSGIPKLKTIYPDTFRTYPDKAVKDDLVTYQGVTGILKETMVLMPTKDGNFTIPEVKIKWFDITEQKTKTAVLPAKTIFVQKMANHTNNQNSTTEKVDKDPQNLTAPQGKDAVDLGSEHNELSLKEKASSSSLFNISRENMGWIVAILVSIISLFLFWRQGKHKKSVESDSDFKTSSNDNKEFFNKIANRINPCSKIENSLKDACLKNDPKLCERLMLDFIQQKFKNESFSNLTSAVHLFNEDMAREIQSLNEHLYANSTTSWEGQKFWMTFQRQKFTHKVFGTEQQTLQPLYPKFKEK